MILARACPFNEDIDYQIKIILMIILKGWDAFNFSNGGERERTEMM